MIFDDDDELFFDNSNSDDDGRLRTVDETSLKRQVQHWFPRIEACKDLDLPHTLQTDDWSHQTVTTSSRRATTSTSRHGQLGQTTVVIVLPKRVVANLVELTNVTIEFIYKI